MGRPKEFNQAAEQGGGGGGGGGVHSTPTTATTTIQVYGDQGDFASSAISAQAMLCSYYVKILKN